MPRIQPIIVFILTMQRLWQATLLISIAAILFLATTSNTYPIPSAPNDKINHLLAFLELTLVTRLAWPRLSFLWYAPGLLAFGLILEIVQANPALPGFLPGGPGSRCCRHWPWPAALARPATGPACKGAKITLTRVRYFLQLCRNSL